MSHRIWNKDMQLEQLIRINTILGWRFILNNHRCFLSLIMKNLNLVNTAQKTLLFVKLKKKTPLFQSNWFYSKIAVTLWLQIFSIKQKCILIIDLWPNTDCAVENKRLWCLKWRVTIQISHSIKNVLDLKSEPTGCMINSLLSKEREWLFQKYV